MTTQPPVNNAFFAFAVALEVCESVYLLFLGGAQDTPFLSKSVGINPVVLTLLACHREILCVMFISPC